MTSLEDRAMLKKLLRSYLVERQIEGLVRLGLSYQQLSLATCWRHNAVIAWRYGRAIPPSDVVVTLHDLCLTALMLVEKAGWTSRRIVDWLFEVDDEHQRTRLVLVREAPMDVLSSAASEFVDSLSVLKAPEGWLAELYPDIVIRDPYGWSGKKSLLQPITYEEFERRLVQSAISTRHE